MTTNGQAIVIDADAHVVECERTWEFMDPSERQYRPTPLQTAEKGGVKQQFWLVDGKVRGLRFPAFSPEALEQRAKQAGRKFADMDASREMGNVDMRLEHMDQTGVDVEVLHNTMFIEAVTERAAVEVALCKSWNRWLADIWEHGKGRLLWSCMPPILSMPDALDQIRWSKQHGACAVLMRPIEGSRLLADPYFYPIYDEAQKLDIPIAVHIANGNSLAQRSLSPSGVAGGGLASLPRANGGGVQRCDAQRRPSTISQTALGIHRSQRAVAALGIA